MKNFVMKKAFFCFFLLLLSIEQFTRLTNMQICQIFISCDSYQLNHKHYKDFYGDVSWRHCGSIIGSWKKINNFKTSSECMRNVAEFIYDLTYNSDDITKEVSQWMSDVLYEALNGTESWPPYTPYQVEMQKLYNKEYQSYTEKYPPEIHRDFQPVVETEHHSLRFSDKRIQNYIRQRDILDIGAFLGDSLLVLQNYTDHTIFSFELNQENFKTLTKMSQMVGEKSNTTLMGMGSKEFYTGINEKGHMSTLNDQSSMKVQISTVDLMAKRYGMKVGFIKADVEGMAYDIMLGAKETLVRDKPVLGLLVYHCYDEFHGIPQLLREIGGYIFEYRGSQPDQGDLAEGMLFAIPQEVYYPNRFTGVITNFES